MQRLEDVTPTPEVQSILDTMAKGPEGVDTSPHVYLTIAHNPAMLVALRNMGDTLRTSTLLEAREREVIVHRVSARADNAYEFGIHAKLLAGPLGLGEDWLRAIWSGTPEDLAEPSHRVLCQAVDELHDTTTVTDATWAALREHFDEAQIVEIIFMVGYYHLVSFAEMAFGCEPEPWAASPPS